MDTVQREGYTMWHCRMRKVKGKASQHACVSCGGRANQWAYDNADPDERADTFGAHRGKRYSTDSDHYVPMCVGCHKSFDRERREREATA